MSNLFKQIIQNRSTRLIFMIFMFVIIIVGFFLVTTYYNQIKLYEEIQYQKLSAISKTLTQSLNGDEHQLLLSKYKSKNDILTNEQDSIYLKIHQELYRAEKSNKTGSTIYTLVYDPINSTFRYGVSSSEKPFFRHIYHKFPSELKNNYRKGGIISRYSSENGTWISAFSPILNSKNEVVAVVEVDVKFNEFIKKARREIFKSMLFLIIVILIIGIFLYRSVKKILRQEEKMKNILIDQKSLIEEKNKDITDSINYAKKIQDAILPTKADIKMGLETFFILFKPRDIVSGDFYWYHQFEDDSQIIVVGDCTGHGIPGALVSVIGSSLLNEIVKQRKIKSPAKILDLLDKGVNSGLGSVTKKGEQRDGMDISICYVDSKKEKITFAGAFRPLLRVNKGILEEFKGNRFPIGGGDLYDKSAFDETDITINQNDAFYMYSDGLADQFGGPKGKKMMTKQFKSVIQKNNHLAFEEQALELENFMTEWKGAHDQNDDILVLGFTFT